MENTYFTIITITLSLVALGCFFLGIIVYLQGRRVWSNIFFSLMAASSAVWVGAGVGFHYANVAENIPMIGLIDTISFIAGISIILFAFYLVRSLETGELEMSRQEAIWFAVPYVLFVLALSFFPEGFLTNFTPMPDDYMNSETPVEPGYTLYSIYYFAMFLWGAFVAVRKRMRATDPVIKAQFLYISTGVTVTGVIATFFSLVLPGLYPAFDLFWVGNSAVFIFVLAFAFAILKHHMFEVKVIAAELFAFLMWSFAVVELVIAKSWVERGIRSVVLVVMTGGAIFLVRSVMNEVKQKEQLHDLNEHLEDKVREQTKEIRRAYEVEKEARHELEALDKAKTDFILTTQHHLRTPLTVARAVITNLQGKKEGDAFGKMDIAFVEKGVHATDTLAKLVNEFLDIAQMEVGKSIFNKKPTSLHPLIDEILDELSHDIEQKRLHIEKVFSEKAKQTTVAVDQKKMRDAMLNIVDNAVKYTPGTGTIRILGDIVTHPIERTEWYQLKIQDAGIGITPEDREKMFIRSFERGEKAKEVNATGRGIGLMLSKQIIESHGGSVRAESEGRDKGSTFTIELPVTSAK